MAGGWSSRTCAPCAPGAARRPATRSTATRPASRPPPARSARASPTRSAWPWPPGANAASSTPTRAEADSPFAHHVYAICSDGDLQEGVSAEASSIAGTQQLGNLTLVYDANRISIEGDTDVAFTEDVGARYEAYGWHVQTVDWTNDGTDYVEDVPELYAAVRAADAVTDRPSLIVLRTVIAWPAPTAQGTGKSHGSALGADEVAATKKILGFDPEAHFEVPADVLERTRSLVERGKEQQAAWQKTFDSWQESAPADTVEVFRRMQTRALPDGLADALPTFDADPKGVATRKASGQVINAVAAAHARAVGRFGRPGRVQQHDHRGRPLLHPREPLHRPVVRRPARRTGAALRHPRARHGRHPQRHRRCTAAPGSSAARS